jgi:ABC-type lipoprotein export system ATPase subunit
MTVRCEKLIPLPLLEQDISGSDVWDVDSVLFEQGKSYIIEAPSGKGKTSLLSVIYGIRNDYRGKVLLNDNPVSGFSWKDWSAHRKQHFSYIFQGLELFDSLSARDNIFLKNSMTGFKTPGEIEEMARMLGMEEFLHRKAGILSFGQQQRVAILRALCQPFHFLLADECFSHMDRDNRRIASQLIQQECQAQGAGFILTSLNEETNFRDSIRMNL